MWLCNVSFRYTSTVGWKFAPMMLPVRSNAPSSVSVSHYDDELARRQSKTHVAFLYTASKGDRQKREAASGSNSVELVSLGPLLLGHDTQLEDTPSVKQNASTSQHGIKIQIGIFGSHKVFLLQCFGLWCTCFLPSVPWGLSSWC